MRKLLIMKLSKISDFFIKQLSKVSVMPPSCEKIPSQTIFEEKVALLTVNDKITLKI